MAITTFSSREFNQKTSEAKKAAENGPVFITDRGRTAHVLITFDEYERLSGKRGSILDRLASRPGWGITSFDRSTLNDVPARYQCCI